MNRAYRHVWSDVRQAFVVVAECARASGKRCGEGVLAAPLVLASATVQAGALPTGGIITAGEGSISQSGSTLTVQQRSASMAADWQSFDIGAGQRVRFVQPSSTAVALNRVLGANVSVIQGALDANGRVFLVNPNGVLFSPTAQVNTGGLLASTLNLSTEDFMAGRYRFSGSSTATVRNEGQLQVAKGGTVALIAARVENTGQIVAPQGHVFMAAGRTVRLDLGGPVKIEVEEGSLQAVIEQGGGIRADGGTVYLTAKAAGDLASSVINHTGITEARTLATGEKGEIVLMGDMQHGVVRVAGRLDASAPQGGSGGFVETSAARVKVADGAVVKAGQWLIDPYDFTIAASGGDITGAALSAALANANVTIETTGGGVNCSNASCGAGNASGNGDIFVNDAISWGAATRLTLSAYRHIGINADITASHANGQLELAYGQGGVAAGNTAYYTLGGGRINLQAGANFLTRLGSDGSLNSWQVITGLGAQGSTTGADLQGMQGDLGGRYVLGADIDASATSGWSGGFSPVGDGTVAFSGQFDGLGHVISGLTIARPSQSWVGLFGATSSAASIRHVGLENATIRGNARVGALVGANGGLVSRSYVERADVSGGTHAGALAGDNFATGTVQESYASGTVRGGNRLGGLVGVNEGAIADAYSTVSLSEYASQDNFGGLVGVNVGSIARSYATGNMNVFNNNRGGLVGANGGVITDSYWDIDSTTLASGGSGVSTATGLHSSTGSIDAYSQASYSGFDFGQTWYIREGQTRPFLRMEWAHSIGNAHQLQLMTLDQGASYKLRQDVSFSGDLNNQSELWRGTGANASGNFAGSFAPMDNFTGTLDGQGHVVSNLSVYLAQNFAGGLFAQTTNAAISNLGLSTASVTCGNYCGGLIGYANGTTVSNSYFSGNVVGVNGSNWLGGLIGFNVQGTVSNAYAEGSVTGPGTSLYVGGLIARNEQYSVISGSYSSASVTGGNIMGGLVGLNLDHSQILNSYSSGTVHSLQGNAGQVGGLVGAHQYLSSIENSYSVSPVTGTSAGKALVGGSSLDASAPVINSFWNNETAGPATSFGGTGKTAAEMRQLATFTGWDIDDAGGTGKVWRLYEGDSYPLLRAFLTPLTVSSVSDATKTYDQQVYSGGAGYTVSGSADASKILLGGTAGNAVDAGTYTLALYSTQNGYDLSGTRTAPNGLTIDARPISITADNQSKVYGDSDPGLSYTVTSGGLLSGDSLSGALTRTAGENVGSYTIDASALNNRNYVVTASNGTLTIDARPISITADNQSKVYGDSDPGLSYTVTSGGLLSGDSLSGALTRTAGENVGSYTIDASALSNSNYVVTASNGTLTISRRPVSVGAQNQSKLLGQADPVLGYTSDCGAASGPCGLLTGDSLVGALVREPGEGAGSYAITQGTLTSALNDNYEISFVGGTFLIRTVGVDANTPAGAAVTEAWRWPVVQALNTPMPPSLPEAGTAVGTPGSTTQLGSAGGMRRDNGSQGSQGLTFVDVVAEDPSASLASSAAGAGPDRQGFMRVFVVNGGIRQPAAYAALPTPRR
ncbi:MBG domain-containing protein [Aquabacterium sp. NJ1]|uniref:MBG domain-containing protein n=1 Tax=Aquabacterium sp. NJ1 TaxID=1538295 RepID=UPI00068C1E5A|nr:MBG domain-containing protein [Aquabacterium sp. NJ1]